MSRSHELFRRLQDGGEAALDQLIGDFVSENLWLDFKRSADQGKGSRLHQSDRENLAKAISGFANSEGGVVVWGVDCRRDPVSGADLPSEKFPISNPSRFVSWLESAVSGCVTPPAPGVEHAVIHNDDHRGGYVISLIPASDLAPHQCVQPSGRLQYYMRTGSNFTSVPHAILAGMFGRRPQPKLFTFYEGRPVLSRVPEILQLEAGICLMNEGPSVAVNSYISFRIIMPGPNCQIEFKPSSTGEWSNHQAYNVYFNTTASPSFRLALQTPVRPVRFKLRFMAPFTCTYVFEMHFGADGATPGHVLVELSPSQVVAAYTNAVEATKEQPLEKSVDSVFPVFLGQKVSAA